MLATPMLCRPRRGSTERQVVEEALLKRQVVGSSSENVDSLISSVVVPMYTGNSVPPVSFCGLCGWVNVSNSGEAS